VLLTCGRNSRRSEKRQYVKAIELAHGYGVGEFSNYMLYNFRDTPRDLYERLLVNTELNEKWIQAVPGRLAGKIYSYPMRYAPIRDATGAGANKTRDLPHEADAMSRDWLQEPVWTRRFVRSIEIMKGAAHGAISPTPSLAKRTLGATFEEFVANLYMPEELLRNRNKHERRIYEHEPKRRSGTGRVEEFRKFILQLLRERDERFVTFHIAAAANSSRRVRETLRSLKDRELRKWLRLYLKRR
jgi:hypothetical protein